MDRETKNKVMGIMYQIDDLVTELKDLIDEDSYSMIDMYNEDISQVLLDIKCDDDEEMVENAYKMFKYYKNSLYGVFKKKEK